MFSKWLIWYQFCLAAGVFLAAVITGSWFWIGFIVFFVFLSALADLMAWDYKDDK